ncbi:MAG TPA: ATP-binding cassette domain-containing protein [Candidatus Polarisedimenticolaceae bacterium]|nr:ATP-binding cassette domain-containing protein [Candidatus Polarisedimenticolaceae bacterium]
MKKVSSGQRAIEVKNLQKSFGELKVLEGIDFHVDHGTILALLGPNGAGKTTTIRILSTLLPPDGGEASINGYDVVKEAGDVRANIGLTGQFAAVDGYLTGEENLYMMGRLYRLSVSDTKRRSKELLELFDLVEASKRTVKDYSGGMKRRIDLAMSMIANPPIIFLDEPTTGLDPRSRLMMWAMIKKLAKSGITILLTTQYMDEADHLADKIVVIDDGKVIAEGTADTLKDRVGSDRLEVVINETSDFEKARKVIDGQSLQPDPERRSLSIASKGGVKTLKEVLQRLEAAGIEVESVSLHRPTLDDVFLTLTGHAATKKADESAAKPKGKK